MLGGSLTARQWLLHVQEQPGPRFIPFNSHIIGLVYGLAVATIGFHLVRIGVEFGEQWPREPI